MSLSSQLRGVTNKAKLNNGDNLLAKAITKMNKKASQGDPDIRLYKGEYNDFVISYLESEGCRVQRGKSIDKGVYIMVTW